VGLGGGGEHMRPAVAPNTNGISYVLKFFSSKCATNCVRLDIAGALVTICNVSSVVNKTSYFRRV